MVGSMTTFKAVALSAVLASFSVSAASAATVSVTNVYGAWNSAGPSSAYEIECDTNADRTQVWWGKAPSGGQKSGYEFDSVATPFPAVDGPEFLLGTFTHFNNPIYTYPGQGSTTAITEAQLQIDFDVMIGTESLSLRQIYTFNHDETPNQGSGGQCAYEGAPGSGVNVNGCADRVTAVLNEGGSDEFVVDGKKYTFELSGLGYNGGVFDFFDTVEGETNIATLVGSYRVEDLTPVPLPAAGWMLLAGVGGLVAMKRRKAKAQA